MSEEQKISAVVCYDEGTGAIDLTLFDNRLEALECYLCKNKLFKNVSLKYNQPVHQKFIGCEATKLELGDEVAVANYHQQTSMFGIIIVMDSLNETIDILVRKDSRKPGLPPVVTVDTDDINTIILKTGNNLYSVANYVSYKEER